MHIKVTDSLRYMTSSFGFRVKVGFDVAADKKEEEKCFLIDLILNNVLTFRKSVADIKFNNNNNTSGHKK